MHSGLKYLSAFAWAGTFLCVPLLRAQTQTLPKNVGVIQLLQGQDDENGNNTFDALKGVKQGLPLEENAARKLTFGGVIVGGPATKKRFELACTIGAQRLEVTDSDRYYSVLETSTVERPTSKQDIKNGFPIREGPMRNFILAAGRNARAAFP